MIKIYKIGGNIINDDSALKNFLEDFSKIEGHKILVHGGGKEASVLGQKMGLTVKMIDGRRVTDDETLRVVTMVYGGLINKRIVSMLQLKGCNAIGLSGADGNSIPATKRNPYPIDFGWVGDINPDDINTGFISLLLKNGYVPVFCALCRNKEGGLLNCNADSIACALAVSMAKNDEVDLIYCFEKPGVLTDVNDDNSFLRYIDSSLFNEYVKSGQISGGMIPKVSNALNAVKNGVNSVMICDARNLKEGTLIKL